MDEAYSDRYESTYNAIMSHMRHICVTYICHVIHVKWMSLRFKFVEIMSHMRYVRVVWIYQVMHAIWMSHIYVHMRLQERWGAGVETHFQEISWNLRPVVNGT